jgi:hypothetical protein
MHRRGFRYRDLGVLSLEDQLRRFKVGRPFWTPVDEYAVA